MANYNIINGTKRLSRRVTFKLGLARSTEPAVIRIFLERARQILAGDPDVQEQGTLVTLDGFTTHTLEIFVCYFTCADYTQMMLIKERINLALLEEADKLGITGIFPQGIAGIEQ
jgi:MscS family membrane protein